MIGVCLTFKETAKLTELMGFVAWGLQLGVFYSRTRCDVAR